MIIKIRNRLNGFWFYLSLKTELKLGENESVIPKEGAPEIQTPPSGLGLQVYF